MTRKNNNLTRKDSKRKTGLLSKRGLKKGRKDGEIGNWRLEIG